MKKRTSDKMQTQGDNKEVENTPKKAGLKKSYTFPAYGLVIVAETMHEAQEMLQKKLKKLD